MSEQGQAEVVGVEAAEVVEAEVGAEVGAEADELPQVSQLKLLWADPGRREDMSRKLKDAWARRKARDGGYVRAPEHSAAISEAQKENWADEEFRERMIEAHAGHRGVPLNLSPDGRARMIETHAGKVRTDEHRAHLSEGAKRGWEKRRRTAELGSRLRGNGESSSES